MCNGEGTSFWFDNWAGSTTLKVEYPRMFGLETKKDATVSERCCMENGVLVMSWAWRREPRSDPEWAEAQELLELISGLGLLP